jgi:hypothetical protein
MIRRVVPAVLIVVIALAVPAAAGAYTVLLAADWSGNGIADSWSLDDNGDGSADRILIDGNENRYAEMVMASNANGVLYAIWMDSNEDGTWDAVLEPYYASGGTGALVAKLLWLDADQNGRWEHAFYDAQLDNYYESVMVDTNRDGSADRWVANVAPAGRTAVDGMAGRAAVAGSIDILHAAGLSVFYPISTIPLGG